MCGNGSLPTQGNSLILEEVYTSLILFDLIENPIQSSPVQDLWL